MCVLVREISTTEEKEKKGKKPLHTHMEVETISIRRGVPRINKIAVYAHMYTYPKYISRPCHEHPRCGLLGTRIDVPVSKQHSTVNPALLPFCLPESTAVVAQAPATKTSSRLRSPWPLPVFILLPGPNLICALGLEPSASPFDASRTPCPFLAFLCHQILRLYLLAQSLAESGYLTQ